MLSSADCWHDDCQDAPKDGRAWLEEQDGNCSRSVLRGGSWVSGPGYLRSAYRDGDFDSDTRFNFIGFRVVCRPIKGFGL
jgi:formylglycine-generating enzyme required for sulfatase activity